MGFIDDELQEVSKLCQHVITGSKLVSCVQNMVRVEIRLVDELMWCTQEDGYFDLYCLNSFVIIILCKNCDMETVLCQWLWCFFFRSPVTSNCWSQLRAILTVAWNEILYY